MEAGDRAGMRYLAHVFSRLVDARARFRSTLTQEQYRGVVVLGWISTLIIAGLTITGVWQFFAHEADPGWFDHIRGSGTRQSTSPSTGAAELHGLFSTAAGALALIGGAWYAYKIIQDVPWIAVLGVAFAIVGSVSGSTIRFNAVRLAGRTYDEAGSGYLQLFTNDVDFVVTDRFDFGPTAIQLLTLLHVMLLPTLAAIAWFSMPQPAPPEGSDTAS